MKLSIIEKIEGLEIRARGWKAFFFCLLCAVGIAKVLSFMANLVFG